MSFFDRLRSFFSAPADTEATITIGTPWRAMDYDRDPTDREEVMAQALEAWRVNPIARQIVALKSQYIIGTGLTLHSEDPAALAFLKACWSHPLNVLSSRILDWCDELARSGNLFLLVSTDAAGMSYFRAVPASNIESIETQDNDIDQPTRYTRKRSEDLIDPPPYIAYNDAADVRQADGGFQAVMLHFSVNRPVGALWGESDLAPLLRWVSRYSSWLEDRARLNRFRNAFLYVVKGHFLSEADRLARQRALNAQPPTPGSILVAGEGEEWSIIAPQLGSADASLDGLALKKMISVGAAVPLHFLAEPESATRTTAASSDGPAFRHFAQRQQLFTSMLHRLLSVALRRRALVVGSLDPAAVFSVSGPDVSPRDNFELAQAAKAALETFLPLFESEIITKDELLRMVYRFGGEAGITESDGDIES